MQNLSDEKVVGNPSKKNGNSDEIFGGISLQINHGHIFGGPTKKRHELFSIVKYKTTKQKNTKVMQNLSDEKWWGIPPKKTVTPMKYLGGFPSKKIMDIFPTVRVRWKKKT